MRLASLTRHFVIPIGVAAAVLSGVVGLASILRSEAHIQRDRIIFARTLTSQIASFGRIADDAQVRALSTSFEFEHGVSAVAIVDAEGTILAASRPEWIDRLAKDTFSDDTLMHVGEALARMTPDVVLSGEHALIETFELKPHFAGAPPRLALIVAELDDRETWPNRFVEGLYVAAVSLFGFGALVVLTAMVFRHRIQRPAQAIVKAVGDIAGGRRPWIVVPEARGELAEIAVALQTMLEVRQRDEQRLIFALNELRFRDEALNAVAIVAFLDPQGFIVEANDRLSTIGGFTRDELIGSHHQLLSASEYSGQFYRNMRVSFSRDGRWQGELRQRGKDGHIYWIDTTVVPHRGADGAIDGYLAICFDITAQKLAEAAAREASLIHRIMTDTLAEGIVLQDAGGQNIASNPAALRIFGINEDQFMGRAPIDARLYFIHEDGSRFLEEEHPSIVALRTGQQQRAIVMGVHKPAQSVIWLSVNAVPVIPPGEDRPTAVVASFTDITQARQTQRQLRANSDQLQAVLDNLPGGLTMVDGNLVLRTWNAQYERLLDVPRELLTQPFPHLEAFIRHSAERGDYGEGDLEQIVARQLKLLARHEPYVSEWERRDGTVLEIRGRPIVGGGFVITYTDITKRTRAEATLKLSEARFRSIFATSPVGLLLVELDSGRFLMQSDSLCDMLTLSSDELRDKRLEDLMMEDDRQRLATAMARLGPDANFGPIEIEFLREDLPPLPVIVSGSSVSEAGGQPSALLVFQDITARRNYESQLWRLANIDSLTGLPNRMQFNARLADALDQSKRSGKAVAVAVFDVDHFKEVNDSFGHDVGDELLRSVAQRVRSLIRSTDTLARLGGDEFAAIFCEVADPRDVSRPLETIVQAMRIPVSIAGASRHYTSSIGVSIYPNDALDASDLIKNADIALYRAKAAGRNRCEFFQPEMRAEIDRRNLLRRDIELALRGKQFRLMYQPLVDGRDGATVGFEALLRWDHPTLGTLSPNGFLDAFADANTSAAIGRHVVDMAIDQARRWLGEQVPFGRIGINLTAADFRAEGFVDELLYRFDRANVSAARFALEVTERMLLGRDMARIVTALGQLRDRGVEIVFDNFGTGHASLAHLKDAPIDRIKIDRRFVRGLEDDPVDQSIVVGMIDLVHRIGIATTAEGVASPWQDRFLRGIGCDQLQGPHIAAPMPAALVRDYLDRAVWADAAGVQGTARAG